jgi:glycine cleavage system aminomethyltransferase T/glycine/D-amino acid oxidase-like deaminating enzyme
MQKEARLVVIGAGIVGCSAVYHLTQMGWRDIVVVDQGPLFETGGSTSHAPGLVFQTNGSRMMTELARYTVQMYSQLELDGQPCWHPVGGMEVAYTQERWQDLKRKRGWAKSWGLEAQLLSPAEAQDRVPLLDKNKIHGAYLVPSDGLAKAVRACAAMARQSEASGGAAFYGDTTVTGFEIENGRVQAVLTDQGRITTETVLLCAGIWGPKIGHMASISIPLIPVEHQYVITTPISELAGETREIVHPILRHQDFAMYFRQHGDSYGIGSYHHEPRLVEPEAILSPEEAPVMPSVRPFTPQDFQAAHKAAVELLPPLEGAEFTYTINGLFSFTPDSYPILGPSPQVGGLWVAEAVWVTHGGGVGRAIAQWMDTGTPDMDLHEADVTRFHPHAHTPAYIRARGAQQYREVYDVIHPLQQISHPRRLRLSPFYPRQEALEAVFFESAGWERPQWYRSNEDLLSEYDVPERDGWEARYWSPIAGAEHQASRKRVGLFDLTPFTKIDVGGPGALEYLQRLTSNRIDRPLGEVTYTSLLNEHGGIKCDLTITRLGPQRFLVITGVASGPHDLAWLQSHLPQDGSVQLTDLSAAMCGLGVWGPHARDLLSAVSEDDLSNATFPYLTARPITIQEIPALALRISYVGELGWEIYTRTECGLKLWDLLWEAGEPLGAAAVGGGAFDSLRLEKGYRSWGTDIHTDYNPYEAGLGFAVRLVGQDFIGQEALQLVQQQSVTRRLRCMTLDDTATVLMGSEPILDGDDVLGYVTSANYGYTVGQSIIYGYLPGAYASEGTSVEVEYFGQRYPATVVREPLYDPENAKLKA